MKDSLLAQAAHEVAEDPKIIRIATITSFVHSLLLFLYLMYTVSTFIAAISKGDIAFLKILEEYIALIAFDSTSIITIIVIGFIFLIGYALLPPVGDAGIISYLHADPKNKSTTTAIATGMGHFLQMFEYNAAIGTFSLTTFLVILSRLYMM
jgi:hypothetical protein